MLDAKKAQILMEHLRMSWLIRWQNYVCQQWLRYARGYRRRMLGDCCPSDPIAGDFQFSDSLINELFGDSGCFGSLSGSFALEQDFADVYKDKEDFNQMVLPSSPLAFGNSDGASITHLSSNLAPSTMSGSNVEAKEEECLLLLPSPGHKRNYFEVQDDCNAAKRAKTRKRNSEDDNDPELRNLSQEQRRLTKQVNRQLELPWDNDEQRAALLRQKREQLSQFKAIQGLQERNRRTGENIPIINPLSQSELPPGHRLDGEMIIVEGNSEPFRCAYPDCDYSSNRRNNLQRHLDTMHIILETPIKCCSHRFFMKFFYREHVREKHRNEGYYCEFGDCGKVFPRKALLDRHVKSHDPANSYICTSCDYRTHHKSNMERHSKVHSEDNSTMGEDETVPLSKYSVIKERIPQKKVFRSTPAFKDLGNMVSQSNLVWDNETFHADNCDFGVTLYSSTDDKITGCLDNPLPPTSFVKWNPPIFNVANESPVDNEFPFSDEYLLSQPTTMMVQPLRENADSLQDSIAVKSENTSFIF